MGGWGHVERTRELSPLERVVECRPTCCTACKHPLVGSDSASLRHQVSEFPVLRVTITEYRRHRLSCTRCGRVTLGRLSEGVSQSAFGPRLHALTALLTGRFLLSKRDPVSLFDVVYGLRLSASSIGTMERRVAAALPPRSPKPVTGFAKRPWCTPTCAERLKTEERLWPFLAVEGMPPTNNLVERCLHRAVIWRKKSFGTDSEHGSRFVERILTAVTTLQFQQRDDFGYLAHARQAAVAGGTPCSLVPGM